MTQQPEHRTQLRRAERMRLLAWRQALAGTTKSAWDDALGARLCAWAAQRIPGLMGVYWPIRGEPDLRAAYTRLEVMGWRLALPRVVARDAALNFAAWQSGHPLIRDALGIPVPPDDAPLCLPDVLLIPCVGFNAAGYRLGYGGGFYDRTLAQQPRPCAVGVAYQDTLSAFEAEAHDQVLDMLLTPDCAWDVRRTQYPSAAPSGLRGSA